MQSAEIGRHCINRTIRTMRWTVCDQGAGNPTKLRVVIFDRIPYSKRRCKFREVSWYFISWKRKVWSANFIRGISKIWNSIKDSKLTKVTNSKHKLKTSHRTFSRQSDKWTNCPLRRPIENTLIRAKSPNFGPPFLEISMATTWSPMSAPSARIRRLMELVTMPPMASIKKKGHT